MPYAPLSDRTKIILPWLVAIAFFMQMLDSTILNTALPAIAKSLDQPPLRMQSAVTVYLVTTAVLIPAAGWMAEKIGSKKIFLLAIFLFTLGSLSCALSQNLTMLTFSRLFQGAGGAMMVPVGRLVIMQSYPRQLLPRLLSFIVMPGLVGPLVGPIIGGVLVEYISWHWIFLINVPIGIIGAFVTMRHMPNYKRDDMPSFDWWGYIMFSISMVLVSLAVSGLEEPNPPRAEIILLMLGGLGFMIIYWLYAARASAPLFSVSLFKIRSFTTGIFGNLFARIASAALPFLNPLMLQLALGYSPLEAGLMLGPIAIASLIAKPLVMPLLKRFSYRSILLVTTTSSGILMASMAMVNQLTSQPLLMLLLCLLGGINSLQFSVMNTLTLIELPDNRAAEGNGLLSVIMQLAASLAVGAAAAVLNGVITGRAAIGSQEMLNAFHVTYLCVGGMSVLAALIFMQLKNDDGKVPDSDNKVPDENGHSGGSPSESETGG